MIVLPVSGEKILLMSRVIWFSYRLEVIKGLVFQDRTKSEERARGLFWLEVNVRAFDLDFVHRLV